MATFRMPKKRLAEESKKPNPEKGRDEWWWFRYRSTSNWQAVFLSRVATNRVNVFVAGVRGPLAIESMDGEWAVKIEPPAE